MTDTRQSRFGSIAAAIEYSNGCTSRNKLYDLAARHPGLFRKLDSRTVVDLDALDALLADLPSAKVKPRSGAPQPRRATQVRR